MDKTNLQEKVSVIIPCFNEEKTIGSLIREIKDSPLVGEIIVIDDGSTDKTKEEALKVPTKNTIVIQTKENNGKGSAMMRGVKRSHFAAILFVDGDMSGISHKDIETIVLPVLSKKCDMNIALRRRNSYLINTAVKFLPLLSGARAITKKFWNEIPPENLLDFGVETVLNFFAKKLHKKVKHVTLSNLKHKIKEDKYGFLIGILNRAKMLKQIIETHIRLRLRKLAFKPTSLLHHSKKNNTGGYRNIK